MTDKEILQAMQQLFVFSFLFYNYSLNGSMFRENGSFVSGSCRAPDIDYHDGRRLFCNYLRNSSLTR